MDSKNTSCMKDHNVEVCDNSNLFASVWKRLLAFLLDTFIIGLGSFAITILLILILGMILGGNNIVSSFLFNRSNFMEIVYCFIYLFYFTIQNSRICKGQTIGKRNQRIRVVDSEGEYLNISSSLLRTLVIGLGLFPGIEALSGTILGVFFGTVFLALLFISIYLLFFNKPSRRTVHDLVAGSTVVAIDTEIDLKQILGDDIKLNWQSHKMKILTLILLALLSSICV